jgi:hypothetical protein
MALCACGPTIVIWDGDDIFGDGDGDTGEAGTEDSTPPDMPACDPGLLDCECAQADLDGDGVTPVEGECYLGLECTSGVCLSID